MRARTPIRSMLAVLIASCVVALGATAAEESSATLTDLYVFPSTDPGHVVLVLDVAPAAAFDPRVLYAIDIDNVGDGREHLAFQFEAEGPGSQQRIAAYGPGDPHATTTRLERLPLLGSAPFNATTPLDKGITLFAGPRRDPFFFDRARFDDVVTRRAPACFRARDAARNAYADANVLALVLDVPRALIGAKEGRIGVWATAASASGDSGAFARIARIGRPGIRILFGNAAGDSPAARITDVALAPLPAGANRSETTARALATLLSPDEIQADLGAHVAARYLAIETQTPVPAVSASAHPTATPVRQFGGRDPASPGMTRLLGALYGDTLAASGLAPDDGRETPCLVSDGTTPAPNPGASAFPYLDAPFATRAP